MRIYVVVKMYRQLTKMNKSTARLRQSQQFITDLTHRLYVTSLKACRLILL